MTVQPPEEDDYDPFGFLNTPPPRGAEDDHTGGDPGADSFSVPSTPPREGNKDVSDGAQTAVHTDSNTARGCAQTAAPAGSEDGGSPDAHPPPPMVDPSSGRAALAPSGNAAGFDNGVSLTRPFAGSPHDIAPEEAASGSTHMPHTAALPQSHDGADPPIPPTPATCGGLVEQSFPTPDLHARPKGTDQAIDVDTATTPGPLPEEPVSKRPRTTAFDVAATNE